MAGGAIGGRQDGTGFGAFCYFKANTQSSDDVVLAAKPGFMVRSGFEYGHLRLGLEYNFVPDKAWYFGIKPGGVIGEERK